MKNTETPYYERPPLVSTKKTPQQAITQEDMCLLETHYKYYSEKQSSKYEKKCQLSDDELSRAALLYSMLREEYGYYPQGIDANGHLMWGIALKSDVQMLAEKYADKYEQRGEEIMKERGGFSKAMENKRIEE